MPEEQQKPYKFTWKDDFACVIEESEFRAFAERRTDTPPRCKQQILNDMAWQESLTPEEWQAYKELRFEEKMKEMQENRANTFYRMTLTNEEKGVYQELYVEERQARYAKAVNKMKFI
jgi:hypothetical protein